MNSNLKKEFKQVVDDIIFGIDKTPDDLVLNYDFETSPLDIELFIPQALHSPAEKLSVKGNEKKIKQGKERLMRVAANATCSLCASRIYSVKKYLREGKLPVLFLYYNGPVNEKDGLADRSTKFVFGSEENDDIFKRLFGALSLTFDDFYFQEFPACHFNHIRSDSDDWNLRSKNCWTLLKNTILKNDIKLIVAVGSVSFFLMDKTAAVNAAKTGDVITVSHEEIKVPSLVFRSPSALISLEKKRLAAAAIPGKNEDEAYKNMLSEERSIKNIMLTSLKNILSSFPKPKD